MKIKLHNKMPSCDIATIATKLYDCCYSPPNERKKKDENSKTVQLFPVHIKRLILQNITLYRLVRSSNIVESGSFSSNERGQT